MKSEVYIDLSWVMLKHSGGGNQAAKNILECIIKNKKIARNFNIYIIARSNYFKKIKLPKNIKKIILPNFYYFNFIIRWFLLIFLSNKSYRQIYFCTNIYFPFFRLNFKTINIFYDNQWKYFPSNFSKLKLFWIKFNIYLCKKSSDKILCISNFIKNEFSNKIDKQKIEREYIPIKKTIYSKRLNKISNKFNLIISSTLPHKNLNTIEKVFLNQYLSNVSSTLVIAGVGGKKKIIERNQNKIIYLGKITDKEKKWLLKNCEFYISPSLYEGLGMTLIEAILEKKKIICSDLRVFREIMGDYPVYVKNPMNKSEWLTKLKTIQKQKKRNNLGRKIIRKFDPHIISNNYLSTFNQLTK